jgi:hypothetical protein
MSYNASHHTHLEGRCNCPVEEWSLGHGNWARLYLLEVTIRMIQGFRKILGEHWKAIVPVHESCFMKLGE